MIVKFLINASSLPNNIDDAESMRVGDPSGKIDCLGSIDNFGLY